jgi:APA family basic amino acid/polyamine antiporter
MLMLGILLLIVGWCGFVFISSAGLPVTRGDQGASFQVFAFANSLVWISLSYSGFNAAAYVAGEVKNAKRNVMRGMVIGTLLTMLLCVVLNAIMLYAAEVDVLSGQPQIAAIAAQALGGDPARRVVEFVIALSLLTSITAMAMAGPRVYAKMAEDGALPRLFAAQDGTPPRASIILQVSISIVLILIADLRDLLSYLGMTLSLCLALAVSSLFVRHWRWGEKPESAWYPFAPFVFVGCTVLFAVLSALHEPRQFYAVIPTIMIGCCAYAFAQITRRRSASSRAP